MTTHQIDIHQKGADRAVNSPSVTIAPGDQITFSADPHAASILCFSTATAGILSPMPPATVDLEGSASISYTVGEALPQEYFVLIQTHGFTPPTLFPAGNSSEAPTLLFRKAGDPVSPGPGSDPDGGGTG